MLEVKNLTKEYENGIVALNDVSISASDCGMLAIVGPSGCGKSTLLNVLAGNDTKTHGKLLMNGEEMYDNTQKIKDFASVFQDYKLIENITVNENLIIAKELSNSNMSDVEIANLLKKIDITDCADSKVLSLSGGQKQRVAIARAMVTRCFCRRAYR